MVKNAPAVSEKGKNQLSALIEELRQQLEPVADQHREESERVTEAAEMVAREVAKQKPSESFLSKMAEALTDAAKAVKGTAPEVLAVATKIAALVGSLF